jgi:hypothetical protein
MPPQERGTARHGLYQAEVMAKTGLPLKKITSKSILFLTNVTHPAYH